MWDSDKRALVIKSDSVMRYRVITSYIIKSYCKRLPCDVKLNNSGNSRPLGILVEGCRNSSKKGCAQASIAVIRLDGVYSNSRLTRSMASAGVRGLNTCNHDNM